MNREPSIIIGAISAAVAAVLVLIVSFGLHITDSQQSAILGVISPVGLLVAAFVIRGKVFAPASVPARHAKILPVPDAGDTV